MIEFFKRVCVRGLRKLAFRFRHGRKLFQQAKAILSKPENPFSIFQLTRGTFEIYLRNSSRRKQLLPFVEEGPRPFDPALSRRQHLVTLLRRHASSHSQTVERSR